MTSDEPPGCVIVSGMPGMPPQRALLPRSTPAAVGVSFRAVAALLDRLDAQSIECHSIMVVRHGHVLAEGWWAPYSAERPHRSTR